MEISVKSAAAPEYQDMGRGSRFNTETAVATREPRRNDGPADEHTEVTAEEVVAEANRIAAIVKSWPPEFQVVRAPR